MAATRSDLAAALRPTTAAAALLARSARLVRFGLTGGAAALLQLSLLTALEWIGWPTLLANVVAFALSAQFNFYVSQTFTWGDRSGPGGLAGRWLRYHAAIAGSALLNMAVFAVASQGLPSIVAAALGIAAAAAASISWAATGWSSEPSRGRRARRRSSRPRSRPSARADRAPAPRARPRSPPPAVDDLPRRASPASERGRRPVGRRVAERDRADRVAIGRDAEGAAQRGRIAHAEEQRTQAEVDRGQQQQHRGEGRVDVPVRDRPARLVAVSPALVRLGVARQVGGLVRQRHDDQRRAVDARPAARREPAVRRDRVPERARAGPAPRGRAGRRPA